MGSAYDNFTFVGFILPIIILLVVVVGITFLTASTENPVLKDFCPNGFVRETEYGFLRVDKEEYFCEGNKFVCNFSEKQCYYLQERMK